MARKIELEPIKKFQPFALAIETEEEMYELYARLNVCKADVRGCGFMRDFEPSHDIVKPMFDIVANECKKMV